ncbi:MAG: PilZ domain-containing protein [Desulfobacteraceae bacterium]|nr:MAG: PilZ domain-containing protein [Desulfobacteraceae bacterium]
MFWKKKKHSDTELILDSGNKRDAYRYTFNPHEALELQFKGRTIRLINISAMGFAFKHTEFRKNDSDQVRFELPIPNYPGVSELSVRVRILSIDSHSICRCVFENCTAAQQDLIHKYLLEMQKKDLRQQKGHDSAP